MNIINKYIDMKQNDVISWIKENIEDYEIQPHQKELFKDKSRRKIVRSIRRMRKTETIILDALYKAINNKNVSIAIFCHNGMMTGIINEKINNIINTSSTIKELLERQQKNNFSFVNDSSIRIRNANNCRGLSPDYVYIDEADYIEDEEMVSILMCGAKNFLALGTMSLKRGSNWFRDTLNNGGNYAKFSWSKKSLETNQIRDQVISRWSNENFTREYL